MVKVHFYIRMNMKKIITVTLLSLALLLSACNGDNTGEVQNDNFTEESETTMQLSLIHI